MGLECYSKKEDSHLYDLLRQDRIKSENHLMLCSDSSWKDCLDTGISTGAFIVFFQGGPLDLCTHVPVPVAQYSA